MPNKHTPGSWYWWDKESNRPPNYDLAKLLSDNGTLILTKYGGAGNKALGGSKEDIANARLIKASPVLLSACKKLIAYRDRNPRNWQTEKADDYFNLIRVAIAEAERDDD